MSTATVVVGARLAADDAQQFRMQAERDGQTTSGALSALVKASLAIELATAAVRSS